MTRSLYKGPFLKKKDDQKLFKIYNKSLTITPEYLNKDFQIYNGKIFFPLHVQENMIGFKFGEFINTRVLHKFKNKNKDKKKKR